MTDQGVCKTYFRDLPIILYASPVDVQVEQARVVVFRPNGERFGELVPTLQNIGDFGTWYVATLNLSFTDESGPWTIKWVFRTNVGDITESYNVNISSVKPSVFTWCFQSPPQQDDTLPDDVKELLNGNDI